MIANISNQSDVSVFRIVTCYGYETDCGVWLMMGHVVKALYYKPKVAGSRPDEVNEFFSTYLILRAKLGFVISSVSNRN
jgi:hypothetical protein